MISVEYALTIVNQFLRGEIPDCEHVRVCISVVIRELESLLALLVKD
jgi:hypothetical protein